MPWDDRQAQSQVARLERLVGELEGLPGPAAETALDAVAALLDVYGEGLARILQALSEREVLELTGDQLVSHLLLVHGLHPLDLETRVLRALDQVRPYLRSHGGDVELESIEPPTLRVRMQGSCHGCPSSAMTLKLAIERAIAQAAPEIERIDAGDSTDVRAGAPALTCPEPLGMSLPVVG